MRLSQTQSFSTCMLKIRFTCSLLLFCSLATVFAQTGKTLTIEGTVVEQGTTEIIPFATIAIYQTKEAVSPVGGATTDFEGIYSFNVPFDTTTYSHIEVSYLGMNTRNIPFDLSTIKNDTLTIAIELNSDGVTLEAVEVIEGKAYKTPTLKMDKDVGATRDVADLERIMVKEVSITTSGVSSTSTGEYKMESSKAKKSANPAPYPVSESRAASSPSPDPSLFMADEAAYGDMSEVSSDDFMTATMEVEVTSPKKRKVSKGKADKNKERKEKPMDAPLDTPEPKAGILTAGEVNDYSKWNLWQDITTDEFKKFSEHWEFAPKNRYTLQLTNPQGNPIMNAETQLMTYAGEVLWTSLTDNTGKAELWANLFEKTAIEEGELASLKIEVNHEGTTHTLEQITPFQEGINVLEMESNCQEVENIDVLFVVDATGSMKDEIDYLKTELNDVITRVKKKRRQYTLNLGSVFYRDEEEEYVTRKSDFSANIDKTTKFINEQAAAGGGDYPEAVSTALEEGINDFKWSKDAVARILFLVLDAPPHHNPVVLAKIQRLSQEAAKKGIRIVPVAGSGINKNTEYLMRSFALTTNGTYVFLTDDSGVGNPHIKPTTDEYKVEFVNDVLIRLIMAYSELPNCDTEENEENYKTIANEEKLEDKVKDALKFYPNPTNGPLTVKIKSNDIKELYFTDVSGKILFRRTDIENGKIQVDLSQFPSGIYFIRYPVGDRMVGGKIMLAR